MRVLWQWTFANPQGWEEMSISKDVDIRKMVKKAKPVGGETIDDTEGWHFDSEICGVSLSGCDAIAFTDPSATSLTVTRIFDDPTDWAGNFRAQVWQFGVPIIDDSRILGDTLGLRGNVSAEKVAFYLAKYDTPPTSGSDLTFWNSLTDEQKLACMVMAKAVQPIARMTDLYSEERAAEAGQTVGGTLIHDWAEFVYPPEDQTIYGIWTTDELSAAHTAARGASLGWKDWIDA